MNYQGEMNMNSKRKILLSLLLVLVLTLSVSIASASEDNDNQTISSNIDDDSISVNSESSDTISNSLESADSSLNGNQNYPDSDSSEIELESTGGESIAAESDILSASSKKNIYARVYGGQYKEGSNATIEICLLDKADYYTEESVLSHAIKNVTLKVGEKTYKINIPAGAYEEDGIYFNLGSDLKSGNYSVIIEIPENKYYNAQTFTFKNKLHIISESNKAVTSIDKYDIFPSDTFLGIDGDIYIYVYTGVDDLNITGNVTVTLTNSNATKSYSATVSEYGEAIVKVGNDLAAGKYAIKVKYLGDTYHNPTETVTAYKKFIVYDSSNKIPVEYMSISVKNNTKGQKCIVKLNLKENKINDIDMSGKAVITIKQNKKTIKTYKVTVNKNGKLTYSIGKKLAIGNYTIKVKYYGNKYYKSFAKSKTFSITKCHLKFSNATKEIKKSKARKAKIKITLKTNYKKALAKKTVYIKINRKTYTAKTNKKGVATFKVKLPKVKKTYKYKVTFKGDKSNYKKTYKGKLAVK